MLLKPLVIRRVVVVLSSFPLYTWKLLLLCERRRWHKFNFLGLLQQAVELAPLWFQQLSCTPGMNTFSCRCHLPDALHAQLADSKAHVLSPLHMQSLARVALSNCLGKQLRQRPPLLSKVMWLPH